MRLAFKWSLTMLTSWVRARIGRCSPLRPAWASSRTLLIATSLGFLLSAGCFRRNSETTVWISSVGMPVPTAMVPRGLPSVALPVIPARVAVMLASSASWAAWAAASSALACSACCFSRAAAAIRDGPSGAFWPVSFSSFLTKRFTLERRPVAASIRRPPATMPTVVGIPNCVAPATPPRTFRPRYTLKPPPPSFCSGFR